MSLYKRVEEWREEGERKREKNSKRAERVCHSAVSRSIKSVWLSALRRYGVIIRWQFYRKRSSRQIAPSILLLRSHADSSSFRLILALSYMNSRRKGKHSRMQTFFHFSSFLTILMVRSWLPKFLRTSRGAWAYVKGRDIMSEQRKFKFTQICPDLFSVASFMGSQEMDYKCLNNEKDSKM